MKPRERYLQLIREELLGPGADPFFRGEDFSRERLAVNPERLYLLGVLYPQYSRSNFESDTNYRPTYAEDEFWDEETERELITTGEDSLPPEEKRHESADDDEEDMLGSELDEGFNMAAQFQPSSMGLLCLTVGSPEGAEVHISCGTYRRAKREKGEFWFPYQKPPGFAMPADYSPYTDYNEEKGRLYLKNDFPKGFNRQFRRKQSQMDENMRDFLWCVNRLGQFSREGRIRVPHDFDVHLEFDEQGHCEKILQEAGVEAKFIAYRRPLSDNRFSVTLMLVNMKRYTDTQAENCIYQTVMTIKAKPEDGFRFADMLQTEPDLGDAEEDSLRLLYRHKHNYATGLGTAVDWEVDEVGCGNLSTNFFPVAQTPQMDWGREERSMKELSDLSASSRDEKLASLDSLVEAYGTWIDDLEVKAQALKEERLRRAADRNISRCREAKARMEQGIVVLRHNDKAYRAFTLANQAMFMQRVQLRMQGDRDCQELEERWPADKKVAKWLEVVDYAEEPDVRGNWRAFWRPFQIAFIIMVLPDMVEDTAPGRDVTDLIWFPTGGGKTEAYFGLTAFTVCYRRFTHKEDGGTAVIMRYTLRLLTAQQFNRAATLICALEWLRRRDTAVLGQEVISIGLWIGKATPNRLTVGSKERPSAEELWENLERSTLQNVEENKERYNHFQVLKCPWCGTKLERGKIERNGQRKLAGVWGYHMNEGSFHFFCPQRRCPFNDDHPLPIQVVDEALYNKPPTLLFATVDKFAQMPWQGGKVGAFFGADKPGGRPPELIIQDELHLISGALGTMVGLYETALDATCEQKGVKPKIVASTATIRRATEQCAALYGRRAFQFPPSGVEADDSFFAREKSISEDSPGRKYIGLMPAGKTKTVAEIRIMAVLLEMIKALPELADEEIDQLWTLTAYFNSLKELGSAYTFVGDEVHDAMRHIAFRRNIPCRKVLFGHQLTSRVSATELINTLDALEHVTYSRANRELKRYAVNVLLATNMISVGLDVARLNVMLVLGQSKLTGEYIQSTSRIGRRDPGAAFVLYRPTNSRDRSHYEHFGHFHETFYRQVEPSVVTPFSHPALIRGLHAVLVSMMRLGAHTYPFFINDKDAINFDLQNEVMVRQVQWCKDFLLSRQRLAYNLASGGVSAAELEKDLSQLAKQIDDFFAVWDEEAAYARADGVALCFGHSFLFRCPDKGQRVLLASRKRSLEIANLDNEGYKAAGPAIDTMSSLRSVDEELPGSLLEFRHATGKERA
ncbi:MAG: helicase [Selenomonadaceae bacterium]|nr:helicase [Selenomonadaceae bacterium]